MMDTRKAIAWPWKGLYSDLSPSSELAATLSVYTTTSTSHTPRQYILSSVGATTTLKHH